MGQNIITIQDMVGKMVVGRNSIKALTMGNPMYGGRVLPMEKVI